MKASSRDPLIRRGRAVWDAPRSTNSPPFRVTNARNNVPVERAAMKRTEPSAMATLNPPGWDEPAPQERASGRWVERQVVGLGPGDRCVASTTMSVFDVPSVICGDPHASCHPRTKLPLPVNTW